MRKWWIIWVVVLAFGLAHAQDSNPGGVWIAYVAERGVNGMTNEDIYIVNQNGGASYNLTNTRSREWHPAWSSDGAQIAFNSDRTGNPDIYRMDANGSNVQNLTDNPATDVSPAWSPNGGQIAFISDRDGGFDLYLLNVVDGSITRLTTDGETKSDPAWSPDGSALVYWTQNDQGIRLQQLDVGSGAVTTLRSTGQTLWPAWSPDGETIAFFSQESEAADVFLLDVATGTAENITASDTNEARPAWSPDGEQLIFMSDRGGQFSLYLWRRNTGETVQLTDGNGPDHSPDWQPSPFAPDLTNVAVGLSSNRVVSAVDSDLQSVLGEGRREVFAPATAKLDDMFRVRVEIFVEGTLPDELQNTTVDEPLRTSEALTVYRYMGARLGGFDIDQFEFLPGFEDYVIEVQEGQRNYWEWFLRPTGIDALGNNVLTVELYLPEVDSDGTVVRTTLETIPFTVEILQEAPPEPDPLIVPTPRPAPEDPDAADNERGFSVFYSGDEGLTLVITQATDISDMSINGDGFEWPLLADFPAFNSTEGEVSPVTCLVYAQDGEEAVLPRICGQGQVFELPLNDGDVFWYDFGLNLVRDVVVITETGPIICSAAARRCDF
jgi:hypothetical protein